MSFKYRLSLLVSANIIFHALNAIVYHFVFALLAVVRFVRDSYNFSESDSMIMVEVQLVGSISTAMEIILNETNKGKFKIKTSVSDLNAYYVSYFIVR